MSSDGLAYGSAVDRFNDKTFRSSYLKSSDIGKIPSFSIHLNQASPPCKFTESEFNRRANYWGKGLPERSDLFSSDRKPRQQQYDKPALSSSRKTDRGVVNKKKFRSEFLSEAWGMGGGDGAKDQKKYGDDVSVKERRFIDEYIKKPLSKGIDYTSHSPTPRKEWRPIENKTRPQWNIDNDLKTITARDLWQEGRNDKSGELFFTSRRQSGCRSRSLSPIVSRGRRRRRKRSRGSKSESPSNRSQNATRRTCYCLWCSAPSSCPRPRARTRSSSVRIRVCTPKCGRPGQGSMSESREVVVCFNQSWSEPQLAVLKTFLKTTTCNEVVKILAVVRNLIRERYSNSCPKPCRVYREVCLSCQCQHSKPNRNACGNKPKRPSTQQSSPTTFGDYCKDYERNCCNEGPRSGSKTWRSRNRPCRKSSRPRQRAREECSKGMGNDITKLNVVIPSVSDCATDDDSQYDMSARKHKIQTPYLGTRSSSLGRKCKERSDAPAMDKKSAPKSAPYKSEYPLVKSWTEVIKDCEKFLKCSKNRRCKGKNELESKLIDCKPTQLMTCNNNRLNPDNFMSDQNMSENGELEECLSDDMQAYIGNFNASHCKEFASSSDDIHCVTEPRSPRSLSRQRPIASYTMLPSSDTADENKLKETKRGAQRGILSKSDNKEHVRKRTPSKSRHRYKERRRKETHKDSATFIKDHGRVNKDMNSENSIGENETDNRNINPSTLLDINKNTQRLLDKASERIKQVETYLDGKDSDDPEIKQFDGQTNRMPDFDCTLTDSEANFLSRKSTTNSKEPVQSDKTLTHTYCGSRTNSKQLSSGINSYQDLKLPSKENISNNTRAVSDGNLGLLGVRDGESEKSSIRTKRRNKEHDIKKTSTSSCSSMTSLDTALTTSNVSAMRRSYQNLLKDNNNEVTGAATCAKPNSSYDGYETDVTPRGRSKPTTTDSSLDDSYLKLPRDLNTSNATPVVVKCYEPKSPLPKRMQSWC